MSLSRCVPKSLTCPETTVYDSVVDSPLLKTNPPFLQFRRSLLVLNAPPPFNHSRGPESPMLRHPRKRIISSIDPGRGAMMARAMMTLFER